MPPRSGWRGVGGYGLAGGGVRGRGVEIGRLSDCGVFDMAVDAVRQFFTRTDRITQEGRIDGLYRGSSRSFALSLSHQLGGGIVTLKYGKLGPGSVDNFFGAIAAEPWPPIQSHLCATTTTWHHRILAYAWNYTTWTFIRQYPCWICNDLTLPNNRPSLSCLSSLEPRTAATSAKSPGLTLSSLATFPRL